MAKSTGSKIWRVLVGILVVILILLVVAELGLRWFIGDQLRSTFEDDAQEQGVTLEEDPSISFGATPLVFSLLGRNIAQMEVTTPSTLQIDYPDGPDSIPEVNGAPSAMVNITDLDITDPNNPVAGTMNTTTEIPEDMILAMIQQSTAASQEGSDSTDFGAAIVQNLIKITDVSAQPDTNALDVEFTGGAAVLALEPRVENNELRFQAASANLFGFDLPEQVTGMITAALEEGMQNATGDMEITEFTVIEGGVKVSIRGENLPLSELSATATGATGQAENTQ